MASRKSLPNEHLGEPETKQKMDKITLRQAMKEQKVSNIPGGNVNDIANGKELSNFLKRVIQAPTI